MYSLTETSHFHYCAQSVLVCRDGWKRGISWDKEMVMQLEDDNLQMASVHVSVTRPVSKIKPPLFLLSLMCPPTDLDCDGRKGFG